MPRLNSAVRAAPCPSLELEYLRGEELAACAPAWWDGVLGIVPFGASTAIGCAADVPVAPVPLRVLGEAASATEVWRLGEALQSGSIGRVRYRKGSHALFGCIVSPEPNEAGAQSSDPRALPTLTSAAYAEIFTALQQLGYPHLLRVWNYFAAINQETELGERYRQFNSARQEAFRRNRREVEGNVPAACALGSAPGSPLVIYFLAGSAPARAVENPRQLSAYRYPREYGPHSPTFSRASIADPSVGAQLFISGTASIVGHQSVHAGDAAAQAREAAVNIAALIEAANEAAGTKAYSVEALRYKAYVRNARDLAAIRAELADNLAAAHPITYLQADICRSELLVEIEAVGAPRPIGGAGRA